MLHFYLIKQDRRFWFTSLNQRKNQMKMFTLKTQGGKPDLAFQISLPK